jgi:cytochrome c oxidase subunit 2
VKSGIIALVLLQSRFPLRPEAASTVAGDVDRLFFVLTGITLFFSVGIFATIFYFMLKYRRRSEDIMPPPTQQSVTAELIWIVIPSLICVFLFFWASRLYFRSVEPPVGSTEIFVVGKQWMWHLQHASGQREIDSLHIPVGVPIKLTMTSQDVIHDFFVPAFRVKMDVLPGRYTSEWFEVNKTGAYHLFCAQYCGTLHSGMTGWIYVLEPVEYAQWLRENSSGESMAQTGAQLFVEFGCASCHASNGTGSGPSLQGAFGQSVTLENGKILVVDEDFIHRAIVNPNSLRLPNSRQIMPTFQGQLNEEQILQLIAFIKSLGQEDELARKVDAR